MTGTMAAVGAGLAVIGAGLGIGRIGGIIMPWICAEIMEIDLYGPFMVFFLMSSLTAFLSYYLPFDTREKDLDG